MSRLKPAYYLFSIYACHAFAGSFLDAAEYIEPQMVELPAGEFVMGSSDSDIGRLADEGPQHSVNISAFKISIYEVTFDEWDACVADGGCDYSPADNGWGRGTRPVINVSWLDVKQYIRWLNRKSGRRYRLPSEAQWEYAARAGTVTPFSSGDCISTDQANYNGEIPYPGCPKGIYRRQTLPVGSLAHNPWGLHDIHGNVWEWTTDCWAENYEGAPKDGSPTRSESCSERVVRGGSWPYQGTVQRSAFRDKYSVGNRNDSLGFRLSEETIP